MYPVHFPCGVLHDIKEFRLNYTQRYASFGTGSSKQNARTTNAREYYVSTYEQDWTDTKLRQWRAK